MLGLKLQQMMLEREVNTFALVCAEWRPRKGIWSGKCKEPVHLTSLKWRLWSGGQRPCGGTILSYTGRPPQVKRQISF